MPGHYGRSSSSGSRGSAAPGGGGGGGWSPGVGGKQHQPKAKAAPVSTGGRSAALQAIAAASAKKALPPQLGGSGTAAQAAKVSGVPLGGTGLPPQLGGSSSAAQAAKFIPQKGRTYPGGIQSQWKNFLKHRMNTQQMKGKFTDIKGYKPSYVPNYTHALGGYDWKQNFPNSADWVDKGLAYGYQHLTEATKALMDPTSYGTGIFGLTQNLGNAFSKANIEAAKNVQGFTGEGVSQEALEKYHNWQNLARGGLADLYRYGGFSG